MKGTLEPARRNTDKSRQKCGADINGETPLRCVWKLTDLSKSVKCRGDMSSLRHKWRPRIGFTTLRRDMWQYVTETATERRKNYETHRTNTTLTFLF